MKNKDRIEQLEKRVAVLENLVHILQMKTTPKVTASAPVEWPSWKPYWSNGPLGEPKHTITAAGTPTTLIPMMDTQCSFHH